MTTLNYFTYLRNMGLTGVLIASQDYLQVIGTGNWFQIPYGMNDNGK